MLKEYHIRVHSPTRRDDEIKRWFESRCIHWYCAYETQANRSHYQAYISSTYAPQSLRQYIKKELQLEGNRQYALSELRKDTISLVCYLMKEHELVTKNIPMEIITAAKAQADEIQETKQKPKDKFKTTVQQIIDTIKPDSNPSKVLVYVVAFFWNKRRLMPDTFQINKYVRTVSMYLRGGAAMREMIAEQLTYEGTYPFSQHADALELADQIFIFETE